MTSENPFTLEKDSKRFFQTVAKNSILDSDRHIKSQQGKDRIKRLNQQVNMLAKQRQQILFRDAQVNYIFKKQKPIIKLQDYIDKKDNRKKNPIKQKRQTLHEYINKKKQILLSKMNINNKKQETNKLEDTIKDQQQTLRARQLYYKNDVEFMNNFITQVKKQAEAAQPKADQLAYTQNLTKTLTSLEIEIQKKENLISKAKDDFKSLSNYKQFLDKFLHLKNSSWRPYERKQQKQQMFFLTQGQQKNNTPKQKPKITIVCSPQNLLEIFNQILENNLSQIQSSHDAESELQKVNKLQKSIRQQNENVQQQYKQRVALLQKTLIKHTKRNQKLKQMKKNNRTNVKINDNQDLDVQKIGNKIVQIYRQINHKNKTLQLKPNDSKELKKYMKQIQHQITRLNEMLEREKQIDPNRNQQIQKQIKQNKKKQNMLRNKQMAKQKDEKKQNQNYKKNQMSQLQFQKGRKAMPKVLVQKPNKQKKAPVVDNKDQDERYFKNETSSGDEL